MLSGESEVVLANLDWLMVHADMRLDYAARCVRNDAGDPVYLLDDLASPALTPAGSGLAISQPLPICYAAVTSSLNMVPKPLGS